MVNFSQDPSNNSLNFLTNKTAKMNIKFHIHPLNSRQGLLTSNLSWRRMTLQEEQAVAPARDPAIVRSCIDLETKVVSFLG